MVAARAEPLYVIALPLPPPTAAGQERRLDIAVLHRFGHVQITHPRQSMYTGDIHPVPAATELRLAESATALARELFRRPGGGSTPNRSCRAQRAQTKSSARPEGCLWAAPPWRQRTPAARLRRQTSGACASTHSRAARTRKAWHGHR